MLYVVLYIPQGKADSFKIGFGKYGQKVGYGNIKPRRSADPNTSHSLGVPPLYTPFFSTHESILLIVLEYICSRFLDCQKTILLRITF